MKLSKLKYILCGLFLWLSIVQVHGQSPDEQTMVTGKVVNENNDPLPGVKVYIQEGKAGKSVNTDGEGKFYMKCTSSDVFVFKMQGYLTLTKPATEINETRIKLIKALIDAGDDDDVYIPFGVRKRRQISASISTVRGDELPQIPSSSLNNVLTGRLSGLLISANGSQQPGMDISSFLIRGRSSYNNSQDPLILVDGAERDFRSMDLNEIESVSVLKDAGTLAWYGMYAANGVVYVKTKRGNATSTKVTFDAQGGAQKALQITQPLNSYTYATLFNQGLANSGNTAKYDATALNAYQTGSDPYNYPTNNFVRDFTRNIAPTQRYVATVSGGNSFVKFYTLLSYFNQGGIYKGGTNNLYDANTNFERYNLRTNLDLHVNKNLDVSLDIGGRIFNLRFPQVGTGTFLNTIYSTPPNAFPVLNADGSYGGTSLFQKNNPLAMLSAAGVSTDLTRNMLTSISAKQKMNGILDGLSFNIFYSYDITGLYRSGFDQNYEVYDQTGARFGTASIAKYSANTFSGNIRKNELWAGFDYDHNFGKNGFNISTRASQATYATYGSLPNDREGWSNRISYNYSQRYFLELTGTVSGSESFMPGKRFGFFPAASAGWIISDEKFLKNVNFLSFLKLRASYGLVGNDALTTLVRRFAFIDSYNRSATGYNFGTSYTAVGGTSENALANPDLTWEKAYKSSVGFDAKFFKESLSISTDYFYEDRKDLLTTPLYPSILGRNLVQSNDGEASYKGVEINANYKTKFGKVDFNIFGNYTYNTSKIIAINEGAGLPDYQKVNGHPIASVVQGTSNVRNFLQSDGIFQSQAQIDASPIQRFSATVRPGDIKYKDINNDGVIDNLDFVATDYNYVPSAYYGFGFSAAYQNFDFSAFFQGTSGSTISVQNIINSGNANNGYLNQFSVDSWTPANPTASYPRLLQADRGNNTQNSDFWLRSGDYLRLKNVEIGYSLPASLIKRAKLSQVRFYISGLNMLTFDKLGSLNIDPEVPEAGYNSSYPLMKVYSFGLNLKF
ncbi:TonB-linked SusC/RagA family outer membrane protein [Mucilaginibacter gracilis]|uniref:TonB-linked SusC/RagA family outer membrane protein n=1 Tax=Mucilaginibacter gracilis TaxID=423350 RepID=A0A495J0X7_9SPHI|nr:TonB-dependent receptor [Mucilaginibacter gracilis]RKR81964.1 TonB-linked SusC/RagA family outer membrane protein [Mucilaginibacter gracilis]